MQKISLVVAMTPDLVIGSGNKLLWHLPNDFKYFKALTMGKPIIMGRKTFESIGKPLPGRQNIILTQSTHWQKEGCEVVHSVEEALNLVQTAPEVMIVGGGEIYRLFYPFATHMYITYVKTHLSGETRFVSFDPKEWQEISRQDCMHDDKHAYDYSFVILVRGHQL
ncbi:MAG: dihydrofolate reductase [Candidatus Berkiellales bacterium]